MCEPPKINIDETRINLHGTNALNGQNEATDTRLNLQTPRRGLMKGAKIARSVQFESAKMTRSVSAK